MINLLNKQNILQYDDWVNSLKENGGFILIDKEEGLTSFQLIKKIKYKFKNFKVGHSGTLDPLASGLLIIAIGKATKQLNLLQNNDKQYEGIIKLGATTPSFDRETPEIEKTSIDNIKESDILQLKEKFQGTIKQVPPNFSALKFEGKRAYKFARNDKDIKLEPREVNISDFQILEIDFPFVKFKIDVSKGFYVRSFARDFGLMLNCPSYLYSLKRTRIGNYFLKDAISFEDIINFNFITEI
jgi:tRNA pseudouridine55 synthase